MINLGTLLRVKTDWVYPQREKRQIQDLLVYKKNIIALRNSVTSKKSCSISYIKKSNRELKDYLINVKAYYIKRDTKKVLLVAIDLNDLKQKTFLLDNIVSVEIVQKINNLQNIQIN